MYLIYQIKAYEVGLVENVQHKTMNPIEEGIAFSQYSEGRGWGRKVDIRNIAGLGSRATKTKDLNDLNPPSNNASHENELYLIDKTLRKSIAVMKSRLVNFDEIVNSMIDDWILKELLMQYRMIIHGDIDTFLKLRKRLRMKMPREYLNLQRNAETAFVNDDAAGNGPDERAIYQWATRVWQ